jgi:hypothetical protein
VGDGEFADHLRAGVVAVEIDALQAQMIHNGDEPPRVEFDGRGARWRGIGLAVPHHVRRDHRPVVGQVDDQRNQSQG